MGGPVSLFLDELLVEPPIGFLRLGENARLDGFRRRLGGAIGEAVTVQSGRSGGRSDIHSWGTH